MCGIAGCINWHTPPRDDCLSPVLQAMNHRGPDATGIHKMSAALFGHKRLSIIDTSSAANQPMLCPSGNRMISFNGEIYNYIELQAELKKLNHHFHTKSDTETILAAWRQWGIDCLDKLVGMFAFAIWDEEERCLHLVRDRMGEKPLYFMPLEGQWERGLVFASEMQALAQFPEFQKSIDNRAFSQYLHFGYTLSEQSIYKGIRKLPPGHILTLKQHCNPQIREYWTLSHFFLNKKEYHNEEQARDQLLELIDTSVHGQLRSDVPLGLMLSGGVDSSSIAASIAQQSKNNNQEVIQSFCASFSEKTYDESQESQKIAEYFSLSHRVQPITAQADKILSVLQNTVHYMDEPLADNSFIPMLALSEFIKDYVTVCLSGDGGDELFLGYETYIADIIHKYASVLPLRHVSPLLSKILPASYNKVSTEFKLKRFIAGCSFSVQRAHSSWRNMMYDDDINALTGHKADNYNDIFDDHIQGFYQNVEDAHILDQCSYVDMKTWLPDDILVKSDRSTMAYSLEARSPLLDHRLVEFAASLPVSYKLRHARKKKYILKNSLKSRLPNQLLQKNKKGFNTPVSQWFYAMNEGCFDEVLTASNAGLFFDTDIMKLWFREHKSRATDRSYALYTALIFALWAHKK